MPVKGATRGVIIVWNKDMVICKEVFVGEVRVSCLFQNCLGGEEWMFKGVYCRGYEK